MSWFLKLAFVLGMFAVSATAKSIQTNQKLEMTEEEKVFLAKMATVALKAKASIDNSALEVASATCTSDTYSVQCCLNFDFTFTEFDGCATAEILTDEQGFRLTVVVDDQELINHEMSAENPQQLCTNIVGPIELCITPYDVVLQDNGDFEACFEFQGKATAFWQTILIPSTPVDLGCLDTY